MRDWPLKTKLLVIVMATTTLALVLAGIGIIVYDSLLFQKNLERDLTALSLIVADNSTGALAFEDENAAGDTLNALRARPHIVSACIYRLDGTVLAEYLHSPSAPKCPPASAQKRVDF